MQITVKNGDYNYVDDRRHWRVNDYKPARDMHPDGMLNVRA